jgi:hypothetical protein
MAYLLNRKTFRGSDGNLRRPWGYADGKDWAGVYFPSDGLEAYYKLDNTSGDVVDSTGNGLDNNGSYRLILSMGNFTTTGYISYYDNGSWRDFGSDSFVPENTWIHVAYVFDSDAGSVEGYKNGVSVGSIPFGGASIGGTITMGKIMGKLDEFGFWTRKLTSDEVSNLYNSGSGLAYN